MIKLAGAHGTIRSSAAADYLAASMDKFESAGQRIQTVGPWGGKVGGKRANLFCVSGVVVRMVGMDAIQVTEQ